MPNPNSAITRNPSGITGYTLPDFSAQSFLNASYQNGIIAKAGGTKAAATKLTACINEVATVASGNDSVLLPPAVPGLIVIVINAGAQSLQVFGQGTDTINAVATATGVAQLAGVSGIYHCARTGAWFRNLSA